MNNDIRLAVEFFDHPKTVKLERRHGLVAVKSLLILWLWAAQNRPEGLFQDLDIEDIEIAAKWNGESGVFVNELIELGWVDDCDGVLCLHDWTDHNLWASQAGARGDVARMSKLAQVDREKYEELKGLGVKGVSKEEFAKLANAQRTHSERTANASAGLAPAPAPAPSPSPSPTTITKGVKKFTPPSSAEVKDYCMRADIAIDHDHFVDYYETRGWMLKTGKMKDWQAAVRTWARSGYNKPPAKIGKRELI